MVLGIHPFPARMAPEIALRRLRRLEKGSRVLDPMAGSGTVLYQACALGHASIGYDVDPLSVLMAKVALSTKSTSKFVSQAESVVAAAEKLALRQVSLPWIDEDEETAAFVDYWFAEPQTAELRKLAFLLTSKDAPWATAGLSAHLQLALSRLIVTKQRGASLAWDVSHSRPHKVLEKSNFDVFEEFVRSCRQLKLRLDRRGSMSGKSRIALGDARNLSKIAEGSVDAILTSPPYLNAIDYLRGHKFSLVWLGYSVSQLRQIRSGSIGCEKGHIDPVPPKVLKIVKKFGDVELLPPRLQAVVRNYAQDLFLLCAEMGRVLKRGGNCWLVVGDSRLRGIFLSNSRAITEAAKLANLQLVSRRSREIPAGSRYLPLPKGSRHQLSKRMRQEVVLSFEGLGPPTRS